MLANRSGALALFCAALTCVVLLLPSPAHAYPWMIRHHYPECSSCHHDPSGGGALTSYGRFIGEEVMRKSWFPAEGEDGPPTTGFLFGAVKTPEWLDLGGDVRALELARKTNGVPMDRRFIWMQLDGSATVHVGNFTASGTLGFAPQGALGAALTRGTEDNLTSRQHWVGYQLPKLGGLFLRAGRMNLPFGIRSIEHTLWARDLTNTNINDDQQYGVSAFFSTGPLRGEAMAILGNLQLRPDRYRERGYSAYLELAPVDGLGLGLSSLVTHRDLDTVTLKETWRQVHGAFGRWRTPYEPLVMLGEWDYVFESPKGQRYKRGHVAYLQADWEPVQGVHLLATGEMSKVGVVHRYRSFGGWLSYLWFFAPHADVRLDGIYQSLGAAVGNTGAFTVLLQGHVSL
jgi:hypothetical protein